MSPFQFHTYRTHAVKTFLFSRKTHELYTHVMKFDFRLIKIISPVARSGVVFLHFLITRDIHAYIVVRTLCSYFSRVYIAWLQRIVDSRTLIDYNFLLNCSFENGLKNGSPDTVATHGHWWLYFRVQITRAGLVFNVVINGRWARYYPITRPLGADNRFRGTH